MTPPRARPPSALPRLVPTLAAEIYIRTNDACSRWGAAAGLPSSAMNVPTADGRGGKAGSCET